MNNLEKFKPCTGYCQMIGAATALLSIKDSLVIFNSPRWCALTAERELACINKDYERKVFCTEARENDILYGIEKSLRETIKEAIDIEGKPTLLNVITSCSMSLIGDDIKGVCVSETNCNNVITLDAGGFTGTFESGYQLAMIALLKNINSTIAKMEKQALFNRELLRRDKLKELLETSLEAIVINLTKWLRHLLVQNLRNSRCL